MEQGSLVKELFYQGNGPPGLGEARILLRSKQTHSTFQIKVIVLILLPFPSHGVMPEERAEQERVPVLLLKINDTAPQRKTVIILLHNSYKCKEWLCPLLQALNSSWRSGKTIPFIFTR
ncbi:uncharacterized protein [Triticum aestivum]|nr:uncharacterized protein LOC123050270 isoform X2 [Triticum aestivum]